MELIYSAALISTEVNYSKAVREMLSDWRIDAHVFRSAASFKAAFGRGFDSAYGDPNAPPYYGRSRPDLIVIDLHAEQDFHGLVDLAKQIVGLEPTAEILLLVDDPAANHLGDFVLCGLGSVHPRSDGHELAWVDSFRRHALRLAEVAFLRQQAGRQRNTERIELTHRPREVFLCHSGNDESLGFGVRRFLEMQGVDVWYSFTEAQGRTWRSFRDKALADALCMVVLATPDCIGSKFCRSERELFRAGHRGERPMIVLLAQDPPADPSVTEFVDKLEPGAVRQQTTLGLRVVIAAQQVLALRGSVK